MPQYSKWWEKVYSGIQRPESLLPFWIRMGKWYGQKPIRADIHKRIPPPEALHFLVAKESGDAIRWGQPYLQGRSWGQELPESIEFTWPFQSSPLDVSHLWTFFLGLQKSFISPLILQTWKLGCLDWQGLESRSNLSKFTQLLMAKLGLEPCEMTHHLGFSPFIPHLYCLACTFNLYLHIFYLSSKTAFILHWLSI